MARPARVRTPRTSRRRWIPKTLRAFRDRFNIPVADEDLDDVPYLHAAQGQRGARVYARAPQVARWLSAGAPQEGKSALQVPALEAFKTQLDGTGEREVSTTMAFVRMLTALTRDKQIGKHIVPIVPDEARTFGMEGMFRQIGIYASQGQLYEPEDAGELMYYREDKSGQILEEGINEAGAYCSWAAAGTAYSNHDVQMVPFYIYYSMFGFQRIGDFIWAAGDHAGARLPRLAERRAGPHWPAKVCSTRTATALLLRRPSRIAAPTIRRMPTSWRSSSRTACAA